MNTVQHISPTEVNAPLSNSGESCTIANRVKQQFNEDVQLCRTSPPRNIPLSCARKVSFSPPIPVKKFKIGFKNNLTQNKYDVIDFRSKHFSSIFLANTAQLRDECQEFWSHVIVESSKLEISAKLYDDYDLSIYTAINDIIDKLLVIPPSGMTFKKGIKGRKKIFDYFMVTWMYKPIYIRICTIMFPHQSKIRMQPQAGILGWMGGQKVEDVVNEAHDLLEGFGDLLPAIESHSDNVEEILATLKAYVERDDLGEIREKISVFLNKVEGEMKVDKLRDVVLSTSSIIFFFSASIYLIMNPKDKVAWGLFVISLIAMYCFSREWLWKMLQEILPRLKPQETTEPQSGWDTKMETFLNGIVTSLIGKAAWKSKGLPKEILNHLSGFSRMKEGLKQIITFIVDLFKLIAKFCGVEKYLPQSLFTLHVNNEEVKNFILAVKKIGDLVDESALTLTADNYQDVQSLIMKGKELLTTIPRDRETSGLHSALQMELNTLNKIKKVFVESNYSFEGSKTEPVGVLFRGGPGVLKSQALDHFMHAISAKLLSKEKYELFEKIPGKFIYNRQAENVYWEGYNPDKLFCVFDDFGQCRDVAGNPDNEYMNMIRCVNEFENVLHMAGIDKKGVTLFASKFVLATTNMSAFNVESIISSEALNRRFDLVYTVVPKKEYRMPGNDNHDLMNMYVDFSKLPMGPLGTTSVRPEVLEFHPYDLKTRQYIGTPLDFEQVVELMLSRQKVKELWYQQKMTELRDRRIEYRLDPQAGDVESTGVDFLDGLDDIPQLAFRTGPHFYVKPAVRKIVDQCFATRRGHINQRLLTTRTWLLAANLEVLSDYNDEALFIILIETLGRDFVENIIQPDAIKYKRYFTSVMDYVISDYAKSIPRFEKFKHGLSGIINPIWTKLQDLMYTFGSKFVYLVSEFVNWTIRNPLKFMMGMTLFNQAVLWYLGDIQKRHENQMGLAFQNAEVFRMYTTAQQLMTVYQFDEFKKKIFRNDDITAANIAETFELKPDIDTTPEHGYQLKQPKKASRSAAEIRATYKPEMGSSADPCGVQLVDKIRKRNCYELFIERDPNSDAYGKMGYVTFVEGFVAIMPKHFITKLDAKVESGPEFKEIKIKLQKLNKNKTEQTVYYFKPEDFLSSVRETTALNELDLCMVHLKNGVQCHGSIVKYFGTLKELSDLREFNFRLIAPATDGTDVSLGKADIVVNHHVNPVDFTDYVIRKGFIYRAYTEEGDCGSLFTIMNPSYRTSKIFGFHVAGNSSMGFGLSTSVTREEIQTCLDSFGDDRIIENFESDTVPQCYMAISRGQFEPLYQVDKSINQAMKTQIKKSKLYGKWRPALTAPARLRPFYFKEVLVDPWDKAFDKYCTESVFIDKRSVILITNIYADWIYRVSTRNVEKRVYTHMESIMGLENDVDFKSISRSTSMGYPKNQESHVGFSGKQWLFGKEEVFDLNRQQAVELELECNIVVAKAILGERSLFIFADNLKDERRPLEKVETGATRLFNSSPVVLLLLYRRYFGAFQLWYMKNRINNGSAIGVNPYSDEWQLLANKLNQFRSKDYPTIGAGDYSRYDGSQKGVIHWSILSVINRWYGNNKQDDKVRSILWLELVCSKHIYKDIIYRWTSSLPSGFPLTALVNTMYNHIAFRWCYYSIFKDVKMLVEFPSYVYMCALGDDNVFGVRPKIHDLFNSATISEYMAKIGLTYTSELKDVTTSEFRLLEGVEFLKRSWRKETTLDRYVAPLRLEVVLETPYWTKRCHFADEITISNVNDSLIELALHGPKIFSDFSTVISKTLYEEYDTWPITTDFSVALSLSTSKESFF